MKKWVKSAFIVFPSRISFIWQVLNPSPLVSFRMGQHWFIDLASSDVICLLSAGLYFWRRGYVLYVQCACLFNIDRSVLSRLVLVYFKLHLISCAVWNAFCFVCCSSILSGWIVMETILHKVHSLCGFESRFLVSCYFLFSISYFMSRLVRVHFKWD